MRQEIPHDKIGNIAQQLGMTFLMEGGPRQKEYYKLSKREQRAMNLLKEIVANSLGYQE